jgi:hypothetical protein
LLKFDLSQPLDYGFRRSRIALLEAADHVEVDIAPAACGTLGID